MILSISCPLYSIAQNERADTNRPAGQIVTVQLIVQHCVLGTPDLRPTREGTVDNPEASFQEHDLGRKIGWHSELETLRSTAIVVITAVLADSHTVTSQIISLGQSIHQ